MQPSHVFALAGLVLLPDARAFLAHLSSEISADAFNPTRSRRVTAVSCPLPGQPCTTASTCAYTNASAPNYCVYATSGNAGTCAPATVRGDMMFGSSCSFQASMYSHAQCQGFDPWCVGILDHRMASANFFAITCSQVCRGVQRFLFASLLRE